MRYWPGARAASKLRRDMTEWSVIEIPLMARLGHGDRP
jgi:hypothetical protein